MDLALTIICVLGILLFGIYIFAMIKTSRDDVKAKKLENEMRKNGQA
jgi:hypothetical protein